MLPCRLSFDFLEQQVLPPFPRVVGCSKNLKIIFKKHWRGSFKHLKVKLIVCMSRLIDKGSHFKFFSASEYVVFKTIFAALLCARSNLTSSIFPMLLHATSQ